MSIYGTTFDCGSEYADNPGVVLVRDNGENHYPSIQRNRRGSIDGAEIPGWCVPGNSHDDTDDAPGYEAPGEWYRLGVGTLEAAHPGVVNQSSGLEVLLDEKAARALQKDLRRWLKLDKTRPVIR